jgi:putative addiction module killer protein
VPSGLANHELVKAEVATFVSRDIQGSGLDENGQPRPGPLKLSGFTGSFSYESAQLVLQALSPERRRDVFSVMIDGREGAITDRFSPASDGPLGTAASAAWRQMAKIALASVLLEDLLSVVPFQFPPEIKSEAISKVVAGTVSPWAIAESRLVKNARELSELYDAGKVSDQVLGTVIKSREAMFSSSIERVVDDIEYARASKARKVAAVQASDVASQTVTTTRSDAAIRIGNPKWEFYTAIHSARPDEAFDSGFRQQHAALYRIYRTTNISLQDCVDLVRKGSEAEARFVSELKEQQLLLPPRPESAASSAERVGATQADTSVELESCLDEPYTIEGQQALLASDWFKKLGPDYKKAIPERLRRVAEGNFGDWKRLQGVDACELRFEHGEGQRIYFRFTGPNSIELLDAGPKGEQKQILARIRQG